MTKLRPFFKFYGAKWHAALKYPRPMHRRIVEPFAGSAGYAVRHHDRDVILVDLDPYIAGVWRYLIRATQRELMALPDLGLEQSVDDLSVPQEARWLIGFWVNVATESPRKTFGASAKKPRSFWVNQPRSPRPLWWGPRVRERLAAQVGAIRHWQIIEGDYTSAPRDLATWFVDPPYALAGKHYRRRISDYGALGAWCRELTGQVIVCENSGANWLPFRDIGSFRSNPISTGRTVTKEAVWIGGSPDRHQQHCMGKRQG